MTISRTSTIKRSQKEALVLREVSNLFMKLSIDDPRLQGLFITRVEISSDKSVSSIFFYIEGGLPVFKEKLDILKLYKPSMRAALAKQIDSRYAPQLVFKFDPTFEKERKIHELIEKLKDGGQL